MPAAHRKRALRVLHLEDSEVDHDLVVAWLKREGRELQTLRVDSEAGFRAALEEDWDAVLSDYNLPGFSGLAALEILKTSGRLLPFVILSGEIGEDVAVQAMRNGASDYLLKSNLARLDPALEHAIEANETRRARVAADQELAASRRQLSELAQHLQTSIEQERAAIAREIHDDVGGALTALKFDLAWMARHSREPEVLQRLASAMETAAQAVDASQRIMHNLRPAILEQGLVAALQWMAQRFERRTGLECAFRTSHENLKLPAGVPLVAYRMVQEALTNVSKHARATRVTIDLSRARGVLSIEVSDNGRGLSGDDLAKARSFGIRGLRERAETVGGWVDISSSATRGTSVILSIPVGAHTNFGRDSRFDDADVEGADHERHNPSAWGGLN
ncbi:MAG: histidine kinase [Aquincola sp.]|nr:histidine kinase [Aquincola sp.]MDH4289818.1 histidine kinase [Aquincola sp.]MDH5330723.1 histidine kinase [Aquincola sp.]